MAWSFLSLPNQLPLAIGLVFALGLGAPAVSSAAPSCGKIDPRISTYQLRTAMERCEGTRSSRPIAATGLMLASFTIGQPKIHRKKDAGEVFSLQVPVSSADRREPAVKVHAWHGNYLMEPIRLNQSNKGWRSFIWSAGVISRERISPEQLRATAQITQPGDEDQWLPVKFAPSAIYTLVIASNGSLPVDYVFIVGPGRQVVKRCSGPFRIESELRCLWDARSVPAGTYELVAQSSDVGQTLLNVSLRHDPRWLNP